MSSPQKNNCELLNLSSWTLISSEGDILATDCDSESSESSIEVVSFEGSEIVAFSSHHLERKKYVPDSDENTRIQSDEVVVQNITPSAYLTDQESLASSLDCIQLQKPACTVDDANTITQYADVTDVLNKKLGKQYETESFSKSYLVADQSHDFKQRDNEDESDKIKHQNDDEDTQALAVAGDTSLGRNGDVPINKSIALKLNHSNDKLCDESKDQTQGENNKDHKCILKDADIINNVHLNNCEMQVACCLELLAERKESSNNLDTEFCTSNPDCSNHDNLPPSPSVSFKESSVLHLLRDSTNLDPALAHNDSDTDSDFVRLDSDQPGLHEGKGRVVVLMDRADSSIGPTFSFMRNETSHEEESPVRRIVNLELLGRDDTIFVNSEDLDRDDDTESSTEDGVDDRIESEQSEADSFSFNNDVGDLSVFADIGDIPLDVGNVPRNYIHCPNNHLSTILNIIVIIAAILTMGISLGIIMATDLEIEEWQNAYEVQNNKNYLLELQLQGKMKALEYKEKRLKELDAQFRELKTIAKIFKGKTNSYETAMEILIEDSLRKESTQDGLLFLRKAFQDFMHCEESNQDGSKACHLKVLAFSDHYIVLKNTSIPEESRHLGQIYIGNSSNKSQATSKVSMPNEDDIDMNPRASAVDHEVKQDFKLVDSLSKAFPIPLDIKHLQQTLTSEQQRALRWQQLYLAERRQRERERENEEWEDERDRELWEHEKEQLDQIECLKKLLSANMTMFALHIGRWNLSVFDDFANLSLLLSGVAQLKQSVFDSIQRVWEGTVIESENPQNERIFQKSIGDKQMLYNYVNEILKEIKDWPDKETLVEYLWKKVSEVKQVLDYMDSNKIWDGADHIISRFDDIKYDTENNELPWFQIIEHITQVFNDLKQELTTEGGAVEDYGKTSGATLQERMTSKDHFEIKAVDDFHLNKGDGKKNSWHKQLGKIIKKTGVTVGEKVKRTWHNIKSLWHNKKSTWQNLKTIWNEKKPSIINMAKGFKNRVMNVSSKFKKLCTDLPKALFREGKDMVDMHSKCVYKARKQWQKDVYRDPCTVLGVFTAECNDRKKIKKNLKRINNDFTQLLKIANVKHFKVVKDKKRFDATYDQFKDFQKKWGSSKLLLKTDLDWVDCQSSWWLTAANSMHTNLKGPLEVNKCDQIRLQDNINKGHFENHFDNHVGHRTGNLKFESIEELRGNDIKNQYIFSASENKEFSNAVDSDDKDHSKLNKNNNYLDVNDTQLSEEDWFLERARYKLQNEREKKRSDKGLKSAAKTREEKNKWLKMDGEHPQASWVFKKSQYRENKRKEEHRADWLLERSDLHLPCNEFNNYCEAALKYSQHQYKSRNWYLKQGEERHKIRKQQGASDWVFERAAHRKKMHKTSVNIGPFNEKESFKPFDN